VTYSTPARCRDCDGTGLAGGSRYSPPPDDPEVLAGLHRCLTCGGLGTVSRCCYCGTTEAELRPYGIDGLPACRPCVDGDPERTRVAQQAFSALMDAAAATSPVGGIVLTEDGPQPASGRFGPVPQIHSRRGRGG
jgi:hypothetical protein